MSVVRARLLAMVKSGCTARRVMIYLVCVCCAQALYDALMSVWEVLVW